MPRATVGRIVHFIAGGESGQAAIVIDDNPGGDTIRLNVFTRKGGRFDTLVPAEEGQIDDKGYSWRWPPRE